MTYPPGTILTREAPGQKNDRFVVSDNGAFAHRTIGTPQRNHVDGKWYFATEVIDLVNGGSYILQPTPPAPPKREKK